MSFESVLILLHPVYILKCVSKLLGLQSFYFELHSCSGHILYMRESAYVIGSLLIVLLRNYEGILDILRAAR